MRTRKLLQPLKGYTAAVSIISIVMLLTLNSCKKETMKEELPTDPTYEKLVPKINSWLDKQKTDVSMDMVARIDALKMNLNFSQMRLEEYKESKEFIVVPIMSGLGSKHNAGKAPMNYLVLVYENQDSITKGNVLQYISSNVEKEVPVGTFSKIFNYKSLDCNGQFTMLSITDDFRLELNFENARLKSVAEQIFRKKVNGTGRVNGCIAWYLVTTVYYTDGTSQTTEEYITTTCDDPCQETRVNGRSYGVDCGGGSGGTTIEYTYALSRPWKWDVATSANWWAESYETVSGVRNINESQGGHFTGISHNSSYFATNLPGYTWQEVGNVVSLDNPQRVYATVTGKVTHGAYVATFSGFQFKSFAELMGNSSQ